MTEVIVATKNAGKAKEFETMFASFGVKVTTLLDFPELEDVEETGVTFAQNALLKAEYAAKATGRMAIADDSGLAVDALDGRPGVYSARYAGPQKDDRENNQKLLVDLEAVPESERSARFVCVLAVVFPDGRDPVIVEGTCEGAIAFSEAGSNGFGYDSVFVPNGYSVTMAQLTPAEKNAISHRAKALQLLQAALPEWAGE